MLQMKFSKLHFFMKKIFLYHKEKVYLIFMMTQSNTFLKKNLTQALQIQLQKEFMIFFKFDFSIFSENNIKDYPYLFFQN
jgi:hypothetical protein